MAFDLKETIEKYRGNSEGLFARYVNLQLARVLKTIGFSVDYARAKGPYLYDSDGNEYLDFMGGYGVYALGRSHPKIKKALHDALDMDLPNMIQMDAPLLAGVLAEKLVKLIGGRVDSIFFVNSGSEANEGAIKFARRATRRPRILYWDHAFHGLTNGALSINGGEEFKKDFGSLLPGCVAIPFNDIKALQTELSKGDVAAFIFEPVQGKGVYIADEEFYREAERLCRKYGALLIADEVQTGFGRTGKMFAHNHWGIEPDIVTVAKAISGGYIPLGAIAYNSSVYKKIFCTMEDCMIHGGTFGMNTLAMVAGLATLDALEEEGVVENSRMMGNMLKNGLNDMRGRFEFLKEVRGLGLMIAIEFGAPKSLRLRASWAMLQAAKKGLFAQMVTVPLMKKHRIMAQVAGHNVSVIKLLPPLIIDESHVKKFLAAFEEVMEECHKMPSTAWRIGKDLAIAAARSSRIPSAGTQEI